jgi:hypothetical protein
MKVVFLVHFIFFAKILMNLATLNSVFQSFFLNKDRIKYIETFYFYFFELAFLFF